RDGSKDHQGHRDFQEILASGDHQASQAFQELMGYVDLLGQCSCCHHILNSIALFLEFVLPIYFQFQFRGDLLKGPSVSFQEAQAQAILQQAKVDDVVMPYNKMNSMPFLIDLNQIEIGLVKAKQNQNNFRVQFVHFSAYSAFHERASWPNGTHGKARTTSK
ncbi:hypothetical protein E2320_016809, partial [Naja naja]